MCDPLTIAGFALSAVSGLAQANSVKKAQKASDAQADFARRQAILEDEKQKKFQRTATELVNDSLDKKSPQSQQALLDAEAAELEGRFSEDQATAPENIGDLLLSGQKDSGRVAEDLAAQVGTESAEARKRINALSRLSSFGTTDTKNRLSDSFLNTNLGTVRNNQGRSLASLRNANQLAGSFRTDIDNTLGSAAGGLGSAFTQAGASGQTLAGLFGKTPLPKFAMGGGSTIGFT